ncbi:hypothetical protein C2S51_011810 [Perilla frutescens var. frutescens]|nr:hypothetical protein C2S51_011810 [Perilla frutescens var. frutescens]
MGMAARVSGQRGEDGSESSEPQFNFEGTGSGLHMTDPPQLPSHFNTNFINNGSGAYVFNIQSRASPFNGQRHSTDSCKNPSWIFDCGATDTMTYDASDICEKSRPNKTHVQTASGEITPVTGAGTVAISPTIRVSNCLHVPALSHKLLSISHITKELNCTVLMHPTFCLLQDIRTGEIIGRGTERRGLYYVDEISQKGSVMLSTGTVSQTAWLWHRRLGHLSAEFSVARFLFIFLNQHAQNWTLVQSSVFLLVMVSIKKVIGVMTLQSRRMFITMNCDFLETEFFYHHHLRCQGESPKLDPLSWLLSPSSSPEMVLTETVNRTVEIVTDTSVQTHEQSTPTNVPSPIRIPEVCDTNDSLVTPLDIEHSAGTNCDPSFILSIEQDESGSSEIQSQEISVEMPEIESTGRYVLPPRTNRGIPPKRFSPERINKKTKYPVGNLVGKGLSKHDNAKILAAKHWLEAIDPLHRYGRNLNLYHDAWLNSPSSESFFYWLDIGDGKHFDLKECPRAELEEQRVRYLGLKEREAYEVMVENGKLVYKKNGALVHTCEGEGEGKKWIYVLSHRDALSAHSGHYCPTDENLAQLTRFLDDQRVDLSSVEHGRRRYHAVFLNVPSIHRSMFQ